MASSSHHGFSSQFSFLMQDTLGNVVAPVVEVAPVVDSAGRLVVSMLGLLAIEEVVEAVDWQ